MQGPGCTADSTVRITVRYGRGGKIQANAIGGNSHKLDTTMRFRRVNNVKTNNLESLGRDRRRCGSFLLCHLVKAGNSLKMLYRFFTVRFVYRYGVSCRQRVEAVSRNIGNDGDYPICRCHEAEK